ncbi:Cytidylate kinase [Thalassoporum mexicanum PCC 7367]|uniref:bifunctional pantoate--beta-alanine ligase/(d)CMP kinase n=1 Tax=Thalassoporum mexicanum TaxID=3457544 RepID=UPI00029FAC7C|nr:bifunctional pantoate--beta-alanine ligase/(d)CMP kinase [Pseudanabaena sp. PCC 7367]AFY71529.1 Cytidylate kinase [Pseudanabaena sp. PCC 7367]
MGKLFTFTTIAGLRCFLSLYRNRSISSDRSNNSDNSNNSEQSTNQSNQLVGLVPTMGALHAGHASLIRKARQDCDLVVVSIFVNPLQFAPTEDFEHYPRDFEQDRQACEQLGVDVMFMPAPDELLPTTVRANTSAASDVTQVIPPVRITQPMEGMTRPGHFNGVATIVTKLLHIVQPDRAYFGQKDAQQLAILRRMVSELNFPVQILDCPIVRAEDGLALSSRNQYLDANQRRAATVLYRALQTAQQAFRAGVRQAELLKQQVVDAVAIEPLVSLDYVELVDAKNLQTLTKIGAAANQNKPSELNLSEQNGSNIALLAIAAFVGKTRLIDNILLRDRQPIVAIDGPAGAGKSTVTRAVAQQLNLLFIDTGAMYRAVTLAVLQAGLNPGDRENYAHIAEIAAQSQIELIQAASPDQPQLVKLNGLDITTAIRSQEVTANVSAIAAQAYVRQILTEKQRQIAKSGGVVMEGRDIGTYVFPDAEVKIFLTASVQERARRRHLELIEKGDRSQDLQSLVEAIQARDQQDSNRAIAPLRKAEDAIEVNTDGLSIEAVIARIIDIYEQQRPRT